ncbi:MAG: DUF2158 domain-containing protein [Deltaproteobacteria bacterium]|nr:DUF2158 domain-containing protein [Deltaproteobacteria bacterium]
MPDDLKIGDTVQLKSGSLSMTIERILPSEVLCAWFDDQLQRRIKWCKIRTLEKVDLAKC